MGQCTQTPVTERGRSTPRLKLSLPLYPRPFPWTLKIPHPYPFDHFFHQTPKSLRGSSPFTTPLVGGPGPTDLDGIERVETSRVVEHLDTVATQHSPCTSKPSRRLVSQWTCSFGSHPHTHTPRRQCPRQKRYPTVPFAILKWTK